MKLLKVLASLAPIVILAQSAHAHYPFVAPLSYQTFNNHTSIISGFYDNPFASEVAIKNFKFHYHNPQGQKIEIADDAWVKTQTLSSLSLENKADGTYRIRGTKNGNTSKFAMSDKQWKPLLGVEPKNGVEKNKNVIYASDLKKGATVKQVQTLEIIETFVSRRSVSDHVIHHIHDGFDVQFLTHPNTFQKDQKIELKILDDKKGVADLNIEILAQTHDFSRDEKVFKSLTTDHDGMLNFSIAEKGQFLLKVDYQQPFSKQSNELKRYKYTLAFNVI